MASQSLLFGFSHVKTELNSLFGSADRVVSIGITDLGDKVSDSDRATQVLPKMVLCQKHLRKDVDTKVSYFRESQKSIKCYRQV